MVDFKKPGGPPPEPAKPATPPAPRSPAPPPPAAAPAPVPPPVPAARPLLAPPAPPLPPPPPDDDPGATARVMRPVPRPEADDAFAAGATEAFPILPRNPPEPAPGSTVRIPAPEPASPATQSSRGAPAPTPPPLPPRPAVSGANPPPALPPRPSVSGANPVPPVLPPRPAVSGANPAPPAAAAPPLPQGAPGTPPSLPPPPKPVSEYCDNHPMAKGRYYCQNDACGFTGCAACVKLHQSRSTGKSTPWCWKCGERVIEVKTQEDRQAELGPPFQRELHKVFAYPFVGDGLMVMGILALGIGLESLLEILKGAIIYSLIAWIIVKLFLLRYPVMVMRKSASGAKEMPDLSTLTEGGALNDILSIFLLYIIYNLPMLIAMTFFGQGLGLIISLPFQFLLSFLWPMALAIYAEWGSISVAANPGLVIKEILKVPKEYLLVWLVTLPRFVAEVVALFLLAFTTIAMMKAGGSMAVMIGAFFALCLCNLVIYTLTILQMHMMGRLLRERTDVLHWAE